MKVGPPESHQIVKCQIVNSRNFSGILEELC